MLIFIQHFFSGIIKTSKELDREMINVFHLDVIVKDGGNKVTIYFYISACIHFAFTFKLIPMSQCSCIHSL